MVAKGESRGFIAIFTILKVNQREPIIEETSLFSSAFVHAPIGMAMVSPEGRWLKVNSSLCRLLGYSEAEMLAGDFQGITHPEDLEADVLKMHALLDGEIDSYEIEKRFIGSNGHLVPTLLNVSLVRHESGELRYFISQVQDLGERSRAEESLMREKTLMANLMGTIPDHIFFKDLESRFIRVNPALAHRHGLAHPDLAIGRSDFDFFDEEHATRTLAAERHLMETGEPTLNVEEFLHWHDGYISWASCSKVPRRDAEGRIVGLIGISRDITERKLTAEKLRYKEQRYRSLVEATTSIVWNTPPSGKFEAPQAAWEAFTGQGFDRHWGWGWLDAVHPEDRPLTTESWSEALEGRAIYQVHHRLLRHDGVYRHMSVRAIPFTGQNGGILEWVGVHTDITDRKMAAIEKDRLNHQLIDLSRRAGMSEVATSVLHNVGNVLNSVNVSCAVIAEKVRHSQIATVRKTAALLENHREDLAAFLTENPQGRQLPEFLGKLAGRLGDEQSAILAEIELLNRNIDHIAQIVTVQQGYANVGGVREAQLIGELVEDALRMNNVPLMNHGISVIREYEDIPPVALEKHKILQILVNLLRNAKHALGDSARPDKELVVRIARGKGTVAVSVADNGIGIAPENLTRIFAHGFTTKKDGHGFGLHSSVLAAQEMGGRLTAESGGPGCGATFTLELPMNA